MMEIQKTFDQGSRLILRWECAWSLAIWGTVKSGRPYTLGRSRFLVEMIYSCGLFRKPKVLGGRRLVYMWNGDEAWRKSIVQISPRRVKMLEVLWNIILNQAYLHPRCCIAIFYPSCLLSHISCFMCNSWWIFQLRSLLGFEIMIQDKFRIL